MPARRDRTASRRVAPTKATIAAAHTAARVKVSRVRSVAVVVPCYRTELDDEEQISLRHLDHYLGSHDRSLAMPASLPFQLEGFTPQRFPDRFFESRRAYSAL